MNLKSQKSSITAKRQKFRQQVRSQYLKNYMKKIRTQMHNLHEYQHLINLINSIYALKEKQNHVRKQIIQLEKISQLITIANQGHNPAVVALAQLFQNNIITVETIQSMPIQQEQNTQNEASFTSCNNLMKVIKFPPQNQHNQGWMVLIRILVNLNYCTPGMIVYCIKTIARNKSLQSVEFALQIVYILVVDRKMMKVEDLGQFMAGSRNQREESNKISVGNQQNIEEKLLVQNFFDSLMKFSLSSTVLEVSHDVRYYSTKILSRCFSSKQILERVILMEIPLAKIVVFLCQKFSTKSIWQRTKALQMTNDLLDGLKEFSHYPVGMIIQRLLTLISKIMHEISATCLQICQKHSGELGYSHTVSEHIAKTNPEKDMIKFIQQGVYFVQILVESYLFTHNSLSKTNQMLEKLNFQITLDIIYEGFYKQANQILSHQNCFGDRQRLTNQQQARVWIVESVSNIASGLQERLISASQGLKNNDSKLNLDEVDTFFTLSALILSRLKDSPILAHLNDKMAQKQYEI